jgi:NADPH2:quinone reductase
MRAIRVQAFGGPEVLRLEEVPELRAPRDGEVLIRLRASGVNPVETYVRSGQYAGLPSLPYTPGSDGAGIVVAVGGSGARGPAIDGGGTRGPAVGDRVYTSGSVTGTYAEAAICELSQVHPLPDTAAFAEGAALGVPYATAYRALFQRGRVQPGELVLIHGASGGVGLAAVQLAVAAGLSVHGTAGSNAGRRLVAAQGAAQVVDHRAPGHAAELLGLTAGRGYDLIVEMAAHASLATDLGLLARRGRVVVVGSRGAVEISPRDLMSRDADVRGLLLVNAPPAALAEIHEALRDGLADGRLHPVVARELPLSEAATAHREIAAGPAAGKLVLLP